MEKKTLKDWPTVKTYAVNMTKNVKTLHIANNPHCYYSKKMFEFIDFDTLEEARSYEVKFRECQNCFPKPQ